jgi:hypothetical protein
MRMIKKSACMENVRERLLSDREIAEFSGKLLRTFSYYY